MSDLLRRVFLAVKCILPDHSLSSIPSVIPSLIISSHKLLPLTDASLRGAEVQMKMLFSSSTFSFFMFISHTPLSSSIMRDSICCTVPIRLLQNFNFYGKKSLLFSIFLTMLRSSLTVLYNCPFIIL